MEPIIRQFLICNEEMNLVGDDANTLDFTQDIKELEKPLIL